jgi:hypothetical protein
MMCQGSPVDREPAGWPVPAPGYLPDDRLGELCKWEFNQTGPYEGARPHGP